MFPGSREFFAGLFYFKLENKYPTSSCEGAGENCFWTVVLSNADLSALSFFSRDTATQTRDFDLQKRSQAGFYSPALNVPFPAGPAYSAQH